MPNEPQLIRSRNMACFHSQVGGIQNWFKHKQAECKHKTVSMCAWQTWWSHAKNESRLMVKSEEFVAKLVGSIAVLKKVQLFLKEQNWWAHIKTTITLWEYLQPVSWVRQKLVISLLLLSVNAERKCYKLYRRSN